MGPANSSLAYGTEMSSPTGQQDTPDRRTADQAGLACPHVHAVFELEKTPNPVSIDIIRDRRAAQLDRVLEHFLQRRVKAVQFRALDAAGHAPGTDPGAKEAFVSVDIAHAMKQRLVEQCGFDGQFAAAKEAGKVFQGDGRRLGPGPGEAFGGVELTELQPPETARVDETHLPAAGQGETSVGVRRDWPFRGGDQQAASHAKVHNPLGCRLRQRGFSQIADDVLSDAADSEDHAAFEACGLFRRGIFEGLGVRAEPGFHNAVAAQALIHAAGNGFDLG